MEREHQGHRQAVDVGARVGILRAIVLLGGRIQVRAEHGGAGPSGGVRGDDQIEITEACRPVGREQDVLGLDVAMHRPARVRRRERFRHGVDHRQAVRPRDPTVPHGVVQVAAGQALHHEEVEPRLVAPPRQHADHRGVIELRHDPRTAKEPLDADRVIREARVQDLDRHVLVTLGVERAPHARTHRAR